MEPHSHVPYEEHGAGHYSKNVEIHHNVLTDNMTVTLTTLKSLLASIFNCNVFVMADYGCADGGVTYPLICECVKLIKSELGDDQEIQICYEDQSSNDFLSLFKMFNGVDGKEQLSILKEFKGVFVSATGRSFYEQCFPSESIHFGYSSLAMHWLKDKPCDIPDHVFYRNSAYSDVLKKYSQCAARNWEEILLHRGKELKNGGYFVIVTPCDTHEKQNFNSHFWNTINDVLKDFVKDGVISVEEYKSTNFCVYSRSLYDIKALFNTPNFLISKLDLSLISLTYMRNECPSHMRWNNMASAEKTPEKARSHVEEFFNAHRPWMNYTLFEGLSKKRCTKDREDIVDKYFSKFVDYASRQPEKLEFYIGNALIVLRKL